MELTKYANRIYNLEHLTSAEYQEPRVEPNEMHPDSPIIRESSLTLKFDADTHITYGDAADTMWAYLKNQAYIIV